VVLAPAPGDLVGRVVASGPALGAAVLLYRWVEAPFATLSRRVGRSPTQKSSSSTVSVATEPGSSDSLVRTAFLTGRV
jgi:peptidoglycan/LPS O-acetylase OafA/YrhL